MRLIETDLWTRAGKVHFKINLLGYKKEYSNDFLEINLLGGFPSLKSANISTLQDLQDTIDAQFSSVPFASMNTVLESTRRLNAFSEWLAQVHERGGQNVVVKAKSFTKMTSLERDARIQAMGIE